MPDINDQGQNTPNFYMLLLNPIWAPVDRRVPVAVARTKEELEKFVQDLRVETYPETGDHPQLGTYTFYKTFKKGSELENFNQPDQNAYAPLQDLNQALAETERRYRDFFRKMIKIGGCEID